MTAPRQPRQLLGWTVPDHVGIIDPDGDQVLICHKDAEHPARLIRPALNCRKKLTAETFPDGVIDFLKAHAHGATVEYRPNLDPDVVWPLPGVLPETPEPPEDDCAHCSPTHELPESRPWGVYVAPQRDGDGQPTHLVVQPSNGAHVAQSDADWLWQLIRDYRPVPAPQSSPTPLLPLSAPVETEGRPEGVSEALSPQSETELKLWNLLDKAEQEYLASDEPCDRKSALVRAVLAEGWRPPAIEEREHRAHVIDQIRDVLQEHARLGSSVRCAHIDRIRNLVESEDLAPLPADEVERLHDHLVDCGRDWTRVTRAAGLIADDTQDDVVSAIEKITTDRDEIRALIDKRENCIRKGYLTGDELWLTEAVRAVLDRGVAVPVEPKETNHG